MDKTRKIILIIIIILAIALLIYFIYPIVLSMLITNDAQNTLKDSENNIENTSSDLNNAYIAQYNGKKFRGIQVKSIYNDYKDNSSFNITLKGNPINNISDIIGTQYYTCNASMNGNIVYLDFN